MRYGVVIERTAQGFSAYVPDLPGCVATGAAASEVEEGIRAAIRLHLEGLRAQGMPVPVPSSRVEYIELTV